MAMKLRLRPSSCFKHFLWLLLILLFFVALWCIWPAIMHWLAASVADWIVRIGGDWERTSESSGAIANFYSVFSAFLAVFTVVIGLFTYVSVQVSNHRQQKRDRVQRFRDMQLKEITNLFQMINEYDRAVVALNWKGNRSYKVIGALYDKYRESELEILVSGKDDDETHERLRKLDDDFYKDAEAANLLESASIVFRILNWIYAHEAYLKKAYADDELLLGDIASFRDRLISLVSVYMTNQTKFVYGKYRHVRYHLERRNWPSEFARGYRGVDSADLLFAYERTLALLTPLEAEVKRKYRQILDERYKKENIAPRLRYYPSSLDCDT